jgi:hypothetical protein
MRVAGPVLVAFVSLLLVGCPDKPKAEPADAARTAVDGAAAIAVAGDDAGVVAEAGSGDDIVPIYPLDPKATPMPLAERLCVGLATTPEKKRAECCKATPGIVTTTLCTQALSAALRHNAVALDAKDVDACLAAYSQTLDGCDWVGPFPPGPPAACQGILAGKLTAGAKCRSSLECVGALHCVGLGPTTVGTCGPPGADGESCGGATDALAGFTKQNDLERRHPECKDRCIKHKCSAPAGEGVACLISADCQDGMQCLPGTGKDPKTGVALRKCVAGKAPAKDGEPCPGGACEGDLQCIRGKCMARKAGGEACSDDFECRGGCLKDGGTKGTCGPRCDIR